VTQSLLNRIGGAPLAAGVIAFVCLLLYASGALAPVDRLLGDARFSLAQRAATDRLVLVEIDPRSLSELERWPWPRRWHAELIDRLVADGASEIALDVDFSARQTPGDDAALEASLARAGQKVILPIFHQTGRAADQRIEIVRTAPLDRFARHVQLGGVTLIPDPDGLVRRMATLERLDERAVGTFPALLAGPAAVAHGPFEIDFGIKPRDLERVSYVDVLRGAARPGLFAGRKVIVGASAAELGDLHAVPSHTMLSGPAIQALAFESLIQGRALRAVDPLAVGLIALLAAAAAARPAWRFGWRVTVPVGFCAVVLVEGGAIALQSAAPITMDTAVVHLTAALSVLAGLLHDVELKGLQLFRQRMANKHRRRLMARVLEETFDGVAITDRDGRIEVLNTAAGAILALDPQEARRKVLGDLLPDLAALRPTPFNPGDEPPKPHEIKTVRFDGAPIVLEITVAPLAFETASHPLERRRAPREVAVYVFRDVTDRARAMEAERRAREEAIAANDAKTAFLTNMSHELRTPLNAIIGFSDMFLQELRGPLSDPYKEYAEAINDSGTHLLSLINDILHVAKIESGAFKLAEGRFDLAGCIDYCVRICRGWREIEQRGFVVALPEERLTLTGDEQLVRQMVINLLSNAVKYSREGDRVTLRVLRAKDGGVMIEVGDTGIGIDEALVPMLTQPFYQVDSSLSRRFQGTGLGLSLVHAYARAHDAEMTIKSTLGVGTTVRLHFPAHRVHAAAMPAADDAKIGGPDRSA